MAQGADERQDHNPIDGRARNALIDRQPDDIIDNIKKIFQFLFSPVVVKCIALGCVAGVIWYRCNGILEKLNRMEKKQQDLLNQIRSIGDEEVKNIKNHTIDVLILMIELTQQIKRSLGIPDSLKMHIGYIVMVCTTVALAWRLIAQWKLHYRAIIILNSTLSSIINIIASIGFYHDLSL